MAANGLSATRCATLTVDDAPAGEDVFGSHQPIADAVHELITTEPGGRTIGLQGSWGSGKSTIVRLVAERVAGPDSHGVVFDAWAHEGDPLRRSFLDKLITGLAAEDWVDETAWGERREELARRRRVEHTRPVAKLETPAIVAGAVAALFAIFLSAGAVLFETGLPTEASWPRWVGLAIHVSLLVIVVLGTVRLWLRSRSGDASDAWLSLASVQSVTESTSETIETPDPTSIDFESTFKQLMREAHDAREPWLDSLWVLLPYPESTDRSLTGRDAGLPESLAGVPAFAGRCRSEQARLGGAEGAVARVREACAGMLARASGPGRRCERASGRGRYRR